VTETPDYNDAAYKKNDRHYSLSPGGRETVNTVVVLIVLVE